VHHAAPRRRLFYFFKVDNSHHPTQMERINYQCGANTTSINVSKGLKLKIFQELHLPHVLRKNATNGKT